MTRETTCAGVACSKRGGWVGAGIAARVLCGIALVASLQGCIVERIAGNLQTANDHLAGANTRIDATRGEIAIANARLSGVLTDLEATNSKLLDTNNKLMDVQGGLTRVDTTNTSLGTLDAQLTQMQASLTRIDGHLASLRSTLNAVDGLIPFVDLGTGAGVGQGETALPVPPVANAAEATSASGDAGAAAPAAAGAASATAARSVQAQPSSLAGVWLVASTTADEAWLLRSDGTFAIARAGGQPAGAGQPRAIAFRGRWMIEASGLDATAPAGTRATQQLVLLPVEGTTEFARYTIEQQSSRALTLVEGPGLAEGSAMVVLRRP